MKPQIRLALGILLVASFLFMVTNLNIFSTTHTNTPLTRDRLGKTKHMSIHVTNDKGHRTTSHFSQAADPAPRSSVAQLMTSVKSSKNSEEKEEKKKAAFFQKPRTAKPMPVSPYGEYPEWWLKAWPSSAVSGGLLQFVGDKPLFPPCTTNPARATYNFVEPKNYLNNSKNPCWYDQARSQKGLRCVPYLYLAGVAKCGTSDLAKRLRKHPQVFTGTQKEYHWWERYRFGSYDEDEPEKTIDTHEGQPFKEYLEDISGEEIHDLQNELKVLGSSKRIFGDYSPSYFWDPHNWYVLDGNQGCLEPRVIVSQHIRHLYPQAKIILTFRHPTPRLYSRFMSRISRTAFLKKASVQDFHHYVENGIKSYMKCFKTWSIRHCAYSMTLYKESVVRLVEGMYPVFMADWLRVWPRHQMFIMRYEDYGGHERERLQELIHFLGLDPLDRAGMDQLLEIDIVNSGSVEYQKYGPMLPETKKLLDDFYRPFVQQFAEILNDTRFLWKDVYQ